MASQGGGDRSAPYDRAVDLTAAPEAEADPKPYPLWIRSLACYERREAREFQMSRYGQVECVASAQRVRRGCRS
jgi:hypothetical protein